MLGTGDSEIVGEANSIVMLMCLFSPAVPAGRPITVVPLKQRAGQRVGHSRTERPAGPCEAASSSESPVTAPSADRGPYRTTCENPWARLRRATGAATNPAIGRGPEAPEARGANSIFLL